MKRSERMPASADGSLLHAHSSANCCCCCCWKTCRTRRSGVCQAHLSGGSGSLVRSVRPIFGCVGPTCCVFRGPVAGCVRHMRLYTCFFQPGNILHNGSPARQCCGRQSIACRMHHWFRHLSHIACVAGSYMCRWQGPLHSHLHVRLVFRAHFVAPAALHVLQQTQRVKQTGLSYIALIRCLRYSDTQLAVCWQT
jgi:hypothetical protein